MCHSVMEDAPKKLLKYKMRYNFYPYWPCPTRRWSVERLAGQQGKTMCIFTNWTNCRRSECHPYWQLLEFYFLHHVYKNIQPTGLHVRVVYSQWFAIICNLYIMFWTSYQLHATHFQTTGKFCEILSAYLIYFLIEIKNNGKAKK